MYLHINIWRIPNPHLKTYCKPLYTYIFSYTLKHLSIVLYLEEEEEVHVINSVYELFQQGYILRMNLLSLLLFVLINFVYFTTYIWKLNKLTWMDIKYLRWFLKSVIFQFNLIFDITVQFITFDNFTGFRIIKYRWSSNMHTRQFWFVSYGHSISTKLSWRYLRFN